MIQTSAYTDYLIFRNTHNSYYDKMPDYSRSLCRYLNENFLKFYLDNKNMELHYKNVLNNNSCSIFVDDNVLVVLKRNNYTNSVISNIDREEYLTLNEWINGLDNKYKIKSFKIHDYRMVTVIGRNMDFTDKNKFSAMSPFFQCVKSELEILQSSFWNDIMYYEFLAFQEEKDRLSALYTEDQWVDFYDILFKSMDLTYIDELLELKKSIDNIEDKEYFLIKNLILNSDIFKKTTENYNRSEELVSDKAFRSSRQDNMSSIREFLNYTSKSKDSVKTKFNQILKGLVHRNRYMLSKIVNLINLDGVYKLDG